MWYESLKAETFQAEIDAYIGEMEVIGAAYEEMQTKNSSLLQQLVERDERINKLLTEQAQAQHRSQNLVIEAQKANEAKELAQQQAQILQDRTGVLETKQQVNCLSLLSKDEGKTTFSFCNRIVKSLCDRLLTF